MAIHLKITFCADDFIVDRQLEASQPLEVRLRQAEIVQAVQPQEAQMTRRLFLMKMTMATFLFAVMTCTGRGQDLPPKLPDAVRAALLMNASLFSEATVAGTMRRRLLAPAEVVLGTLQTLEPEAEFTEELRFQLFFKGPLFRESIEYPPGFHPLHDQLLESSFDGTTFRLGYKKLKKLSSSWLSIHDPVKSMEYARKYDSPKMFNKMEFWYLAEVGLMGPQALEELGRPIESFILNAADRRQIVSVGPPAGGKATILEVIIEQPEPWKSSETFDVEKHENYLSMDRDSAQLQMRAERERRELAGKHRVIRLWLNSELGYAVEEKWVSRKETGETLFHTRNTDFVHCGPKGVWMPKRCVVESHAYWTAPSTISPVPLYETVIQMNQCEPASFNGDQFRIWYDIPGMSVSDWRVMTGPLDDPKTYKVPASIDQELK